MGAKPSTTTIVLRSQRALECGELDAAFAAQSKSSSFFVPRSILEPLVRSSGTDEFEEEELVRRRDLPLQVTPVVDQMMQAPSAPSA